MSKVLVSVLVCTVLFHSLVNAKVSNAEAQSGGHAGNGGDTAEMRRQELNREQVYELLKNNGEKLKVEVLLPLVRNLSADRVTDSRVREQYATMLGYQNGGLRHDILFTIYDITSPDCLSGGDGNDAAFTGSNLRDRICFNVDYIARDGNTIGTIAGLALHEHAHHMGIDDHPQYRLANYFKQAIESGDHLRQLVRTFGAVGRPYRMVDPSNFRGMLVWAAYSESTLVNTAQDIATQFCVWQGFERSRNHTTRPVPRDSDLGPHVVRFDDNYPRTSSGATTGHRFFETITCERSR